MRFILQYGYVQCYRKVSDLYVRNRGIAQLPNIELREEFKIEDIYYILLPTKAVNNMRERQKMKVARKKVKVTYM